MGGSYRVEVSIHTYNNPSGRCDECQPGPDPGCCDETSIRLADTPCPLATPSLRIDIADIDTGNACKGVQKHNNYSLFIFDSNSVDFEVTDFNNNR